MELSDDAFVELLGGAEADREMALWVRQAVARECDLPASEVVPQMLLSDLAIMIGPTHDGWDPLSFLLAMELMSGRRFHLHSWDVPPFGPPFRTLEEWIKKSAPVLRSAGRA
jgi:hypothetical protein